MPSGVVVCPSSSDFPAFAPVRRRPRGICAIPASPLPQPRWFSRFFNERSNGGLGQGSGLRGLKGRCRRHRTGLSGADGCGRGTPWPARLDQRAYPVRLARLTGRRADRKRPHGLAAQNRDLRRRCLRRVDHRAPLDWHPGRPGEGAAAAGAARDIGAGPAQAGGRRDAAVSGLRRARVGRRCKMRPCRLSPARLTGWGSIPILPHRKNGLKWRKYKAF